MRVVAVVASALAATLGSCVPSQTVQSSDVLTLSVCPRGAAAPCDLRKLPADGASLITFEVCIPPTVAAPIAAGQTVTLQSSAGSWLLPSSAATPGAFTASLSSSSCAQPVLVAPAGTLSLQVQAVLDGYTQTLAVQLIAAPLSGVTVTATPASLASSGPSQVALTAAVRGAGLGSPTAGTILALSAAATPGSAFVSVAPQSAVLDASGQVTATLTVAPGAQSVVVTATATGPSSPLQSQPPTATGSVTLVLFPDDAGAPAFDAAGD